MEILKSYTMLCFFFLYFGFKVRTSMLSFALSLCVKTNKGEKEQKREKKKKKKGRNKETNRHDEFWRSSFSSEKIGNVIMKLY